MKATQTTRRHQQPPAPLGLRAVFAALQPAGSSSNAGAVEARKYQHVHRVILDAQERQDKMAYQNVIEAIAQRIYAGGALTPELIADAAFWTGIATCWHLMTAINGKDGGR